MRIGRSTIWLFVAASVLALYIALVERAPDAPSAPGPAPLVARASERITWFSVARGTSSVECIRRRDGWELVKPLAARADAARIAQFLESLEVVPRAGAVTAEERQARGLGLADYGLDPARARVTVGDAAGREEVLIGDVSPLGSSVYVKRRGTEDVWAVGTNVWSALPLDLSELRDRIVLRADPRQVIRLELTRRDGGLVQLARAGSGWQIQQPVQCRADERKVLRLIEQLLAVEVTSFASDARPDPNAYGLGPDDAVLQLAVVLAGKDAPIRILAGRATEDGSGRVYARRDDSDSVFTVPADTVARFSLGVGDLRDPIVFDVDASAVTRVRIEEGARAVALARGVDGEWRLSDPSDAPADRSAVESVIRRLTELRADGYMEASETNRVALGLVPPLVSIGLDVATAASGHTDRATGGAMLRIGRQPRDGRVAAWMDGEQTGMILSWPAILGLSVGPTAGERFAVALAYRDRTVLRVATESVRMLAVARGGRETAIERSESGGWVASGVADRHPDGEAVTDVLRLLADLRAVAFERDRVSDLAPFGLREPAVVVTVGLSGPEGIRKRILIGRSVGDGAYACLQGQDVVFVLDRRAVAILTRDLWLRADGVKRANGRTE